MSNRIFVVQRRWPISLQKKKLFFEGICETDVWVITRDRKKNIELVLSVAKIIYAGEEDIFIIHQKR